MGDISARELLETVYISFKANGNGKEIELSPKAIAEIADDSNFHRTRISYESVLILQIGDNKKWALAFGKKCGDYPTDRYDCDLAAIPLPVDEEPDEEEATFSSLILSTLKGNIYFRSSLMYAMADGQLMVNKMGCLGQQVLDTLGQKIEEYISLKFEAGLRHSAIDLQPVAKPPIRYKSEFTFFLYDAFRVILAK